MTIKERYRSVDPEGILNNGFVDTNEPPTISVTHLDMNGKNVTQNFVPHLNGKDSKDILNV